MGERVAEIGVFTANLSPKGSQPVAMRGKYVDLWKKTNGKRCSITQAWNTISLFPGNRNFTLMKCLQKNVALQGHVPVKDNISFENHGN